MKSNQLVRIRKVKVVGDHLLELILTDGTKVLRDFTRFSKKDASGVLQPLTDQKFFAKVKVSSFGTLEWPGKLDLCPDVIIWGKRGLLSKKISPPKKANF
jgi:Protein of unknown function (DUF2442)